MRSRLRSVPLAVLLSVLASVPVAAQDAPPRGIPRDAQPATVRSVVDGNTIRVVLAAVVI